MNRPASREADRAERVALALFFVALIVVAIVGGARGELPDLPSADYAGGVSP